MVLTKKEPDLFRSPPLKALIPLLAALCFTFLIAAEPSFDSGMMLHSEMSIYEDGSYYSDNDGDWFSQDQDGGSWFAEQQPDARMLKSGGGRSSGSSRSSGYRSYGNCYGDRCDSAGGSSTQLAIIVGSICGGCCVILGFYCLYHYCKQKIKDKRRRERRKARGNQVSNSDFSMSDSETPVEPIVIMPNQPTDNNYEYSQHQHSVAPMHNNAQGGVELQGAYPQEQYYNQQLPVDGGAQNQYGMATGLAGTPVMPIDQQQKQGSYVMGAGMSGGGAPQQQFQAASPVAHAQMNHAVSTHQSVRTSGSMGLQMAMAQAQPNHHDPVLANSRSQNNYTGNDLNDLEDHNFNQQNNAEQNGDKQNY